MAPDTVTWRVGESCPLCGESEPHGWYKRAGEPVKCEPTETKRMIQQSITAQLWDLRVALSVARMFEFNEAAMLAREAELEEMANRAGVYG